MDCAHKIALCHNGPQHRTKLKYIGGFGHANWVNSSNFIATTLRFSEKFDHPLSHVFILGYRFLESHGIIAMPVTSCIKDACSNLTLFNYWNETKLFELVTCIATKPWLSGNMLPNIKTCENWWSNFSENMRVVALKMPELTQLESQNLSICINFVLGEGSMIFHFSIVKVHFIFW